MILTLLTISFSFSKEAAVHDISCFCCSKQIKKTLNQICCTSTRCHKCLSWWHYRIVFNKKLCYKLLEGKNAIFGKTGRNLIFKLRVDTTSSYALQISLYNYVVWQTNICILAGQNIHSLANNKLAIGRVGYTLDQKVEIQKYREVLPFRMVT